MISGIFWWNFFDDTDDLVIDFRSPRRPWVKIESIPDDPHRGLRDRIDPLPSSDWLSPPEASLLISQLLDTLPEKEEWDVNVWWELKDGKIRFVLTAGPYNEWNDLVPVPQWFDESKCPLVTVLEVMES